MDARQNHGGVAHEHAGGALVVRVYPERVPEPSAYVHDAGSYEIRVDVRYLVHLLLLYDVAYAHCSDNPGAGKASDQDCIVELYLLVSFNRPDNSSSGVRTHMPSRR